MSGETYFGKKRSESQSLSAVTKTVTVVIAYDYMAIYINDSLKLSTWTHSFKGYRLMEEIGTGHMLIEPVIHLDYGVLQALGGFPAELSTLKAAI